MDESRDAERPPQSTPRYLPRVWKAQPEPEPEPEPEAPTKKKKKKAGDGDSAAANSAEKSTKRSKASKKGKGDGDSDKPKGTLIEETPTLDTYQARQTARIVTGIAIVGIGFLFVSVIYWLVSPTSSEESSVDDQALLARAPSLDPAQAELEARFMYNRAREVVKRGNVKLAIAFLEKISRAYPRTRAAQESSVALSKPPDQFAAYLEKSPGIPTGPSPPKIATGPSPPKNATGPVPPPKLATGPAPPPPTNKPGPEPPANTAKQPVGPSTPPVATGPSAPSPPAANAPAGPTGPVPPVVSGPTAPMPATGPVAVATGPVSPGAAPGAAASGPPAKALPAGFTRSPDAGVSPTGWPLQIVGERDGAAMVLVPGGNYRMGRDDGPPSEGPDHRVILGTYYIDQHEVTIRQFELFQKQDGVRSERARALLKSSANANDSEDAPVTMVTARDARDYATWAGKRLPTEAQWEIAARSADGRLYPWGNDEAKWDKPREFRKVEPVRSHPRDVSPFGAYDMAGNAWEWTKDWFEIKYYNQFRNATADNPAGPSKPKSEQLAVRGCDKNWSITKREGLKWNSRLPYVGFRCVLPVEGPGNVFEAPKGAAGPVAPGGARNQGGVVPF